MNRFISAVVGPGYSGKGQKPSLRERVLHLFYLCMGMLLFECTSKYGLLPLPTLQRLKSAAVGVLWLFLTMSATLLLRVLEGSSNAEVVFTPLEKEPSPRKGADDLVSCASVKKSVVQNTDTTTLKLI